MGNALFIIWRESVEAMLVVGILHAWLKNHDTSGRGMRYLWGGVAAGVGLAIALALVMLGIASELSSNGLEYFQLGMVLVAAGLIVQMVFWMRRHGRQLKRELEGGLARNLDTANWWGLLTVVMLAVGRESAETVVFLYGMSAGQAVGGVAQLIGVAGLGFALAFATFWLLQQGGKVVSWQRFFRISEILLLLLAASLLITGAEKLMNLGALPALLDPVWNTSAVLDDTTRFGGIISALTGYRAQPALMLVLIYAVYWTVVSWRLHRLSR